ncbi:MAG: hypothetical protein J6U86_01500 [Clostridia bacterium]|nr:hypothetical protein [Clostridia bacterium]
MRYDHKLIADIEKKKILFQFALMMISSVIGGISFIKLMSKEMLDGISESITQHFSISLSSGMTFSEYIGKYFSLCLADLTCIFILLVSSFTFINYLVTDGVLVFLGFRYGINAALLSVTSVGGGTSLCFWILRALILFVFFVYSCKMAFYALSFRRFTSNGRLVLNKSNLLPAFVFTATVIGFILITNGLYSIFAFIL